MKIHKELAAGRWFEFSLMEQLANVGTDIERTIRWKQKGNLEYSQKAFERALELLDLTIADPKHRKRLKELTRTREVLVDYYSDRFTDIPNTTKLSSFFNLGFKLTYKLQETFILNIQMYNLLNRDIYL